MAFTFAGQYTEVILGTSSAGFAVALPSLSVHVYTVGTTTHPTLYTSRTKGTTTANPTTTDVNGNLTFFVDPGQYDIVFTPPGGSQKRVTVTVPTDPAESSAAYAPVGLPAYVGANGVTPANRYDPRLNVYNWKASNTRRIRKALALARGSSGLANFVFIGDSETDSFMGASDGYDQLNMWPLIAKQALMGQGVPSAGSGAVPVGTNGATGDPRWTFDAKWVGSPAQAFGFIGSNSQSGAVATFTTAQTGEMGTVVKVGYHNTSGPFTVAIDGAGPVTVTPAGANTPAVYQVTGLSNTTHTVVITTTTTASVYITTASVESTTGLLFQKIAMYGSTASGTGYGSWTDTNQMHLGTFRGSTTILGTPDVVFCALSVNDLDGGTPLATVTTALTTIRNTYPSSDFVFIAQYQPNPTTLANWQAYAAALYALADTLDVPLIDLLDRSGGYTVANGNGLMGDTVHPNRAAQRDWGGLVAQILTESPARSRPFAGLIPTIAVLAGNGTSPPTPTLDVGSNDSSGRLTFGSGASIASGGQVKVTFAQPYLTPPKVILCPQSGPAAGVTWYTPTTTTDFTVAAVAGLTASQAAGNYAFWYQVIP